MAGELASRLAAPLIATSANRTGQPPPLEAEQTALALAHDPPDLILDAGHSPGGPGSTRYLWDKEEIQKAIKYFHENDKPVAAICYAVIAVVQTGILRNKHATVYPTDEAKAILEEYSVRFSKDGCVTLEPEKIITAQGPSFAQDFGHAILTMLS